MILVGDDPASQVYVRNKIKACAEAGIRSILERYRADLARGRSAGAHRRPERRRARARHPGADAAAAAHRAAARDRGDLEPSKDVDGYSVESAGRLLAGLPGFRPCTPWGCMKLIESTGIALRGKHAVVIGRSNTVGKPMALMLLQADATVTVCHSRTPDLAEHTRRADVVVAAVGRASTLTARDGQAGRRRHRRRHEPQTPPASSAATSTSPASPKSPRAITPVPGGVGPMTIAMLLSNTVDAASARSVAVAARAPTRAERA